MQAMDGASAMTNAKNSDTGQLSLFGAAEPGNTVKSKSASSSAAPLKAVPVAKETAAAEAKPDAPPRSARTPKSAKPVQRATAESMAHQQRDISVSEFFAKNRHLLGFDNKRKALLMTVKEAVDNSLDACEEAGIAPEIEVRMAQTGEDRFRVLVRDNGPGIVKQQIPNVFGKLLYGSKFHRLKMSRGQQGIGISAAGMYGLLTTGKSICIISRTPTATRSRSTPRPIRPTSSRRLRSRSSGNTAPRWRSNWPPRTTRAASPSTSTWTRRPLPTRTAASSTHRPSAKP